MRTLHAEASALQYGVIAMHFAKHPFFGCRIPKYASEQICKHLHFRCRIRPLHAQSSHILTLVIRVRPK